MVKKDRVVDGVKVEVKQDEDEDGDGEGELETWRMLLASPLYCYHYNIIIEVGLCQL